MAHHKTKILAMIGMLILMDGCSWFKKKGRGNQAAPRKPKSADIRSGDDGEPGLSHRANVRFKKIFLLRNDYARALQLPPNQLCVEAGKDCLENYNIVLGGVDANLMLYERIEKPVPTSPIAIERVALQACARRVDLDFGGGSPLIFTRIPASSTNFTDAHKDAVQRLYRNFLQRDPTDGDYAGHEKLLDSVSSMVSGNEIGKTWAKSACWMVATQLESVLY